MLTNEQAERLMSEIINFDANFPDFVDSLECVDKDDFDAMEYEIECTPLDTYSPEQNALLHAQFERQRAKFYPTKD